MTVKYQSVIINYLHITKEIKCPYMNLNAMTAAAILKYCFSEMKAVFVRHARGKTSPV